MKSFVTPVNFHSLLTCSQCHRAIKKSSPRATCTTCGQTRHLACTYLPRERESIRDGSREWRCSGTVQSPSTSTMPSPNHPTPSEICESTMLQEVPIIHLKTQSYRENLTQSTHSWKGLRAQLAHLAYDRGSVVSSPHQSPRCGV